MPVARPKILLVEDEELIRSITRRFIEKRWDAVILEAASGEQALGLVKKERPDILITDIRFEGPMTGWDLIEKARAIDRRLKVIVISGQIFFTARINKTLRHHVHLLLNKPASFEMLGEKLQDILGSRKGVPEQVLPENTLQIQEEDELGTPEARTVVHALYNVHANLRMRCEKYLLDHQDGFHKDITAAQQVEQMREILQFVITTVDEAKDTVEKIREL